MIGDLYTIYGKKVLIAKEIVSYSCIGCMFRDELDQECTLYKKNDLPCGELDAIFVPYIEPKGIKKKLTLN
jgi:hypothetical protein